MKRLALTMIIRDEASRLPGFFAHHAGLADEIVVVDTGSQDDSRRMATDAGAIVVDFPWQDDYAAARNAGLATATADWIIFLDADERLSQNDFTSLRANLPDRPDRVFLQETWNYCLDMAHLEWQPLSGRYPVEEEGQTGMFVARRVGVFPRLENLIFGGRVHESILPAAEALRLPVVALELPVHHYGYAETPEINLARQERYQRIVQLKFKENPTDPATQLEWVSVLLEAGNPEQALVHLVELGNGPRGLRPVVRGLMLQGRLRREMGEWTAARSLLMEAVDQDPDFLFGWLELIRTEAAAENWVAAGQVLAEAEARFGSENPLLLRESLKTRIKTRQLPAALAAAEHLVRLSPHWTEIRELRDRLKGMMGPN